MNENTEIYCSFVSIQYIICECGETFPSEDALKEHLEKDKSAHAENLASLKNNQPHELVLNEYKCGECEEIFSSEEECVAHQELTHVNVIIKEEIIAEETQEDDEDMEIEGELIAPAEIEIEEGGYEEVIEQEPFTLEIHEDPADKASNSPFFLTNKLLKAPVTMTTFPRKVTVGQLKASKPAKLVTQPLKMGDKPVTVMVRKKPVKVIKGEPKAGQKRPRYGRNVVCEVCGKKYTSNAALSYHQRVHTGVRPYQCPFCPKTFTMPLFMQIHVRIHTGEKPYACTHCTKAFTNKAALMRHDRVHTGEKPYQCPRCGKCFSQSNSMKLHVHTVHLKLPTPYKSKRRKAERAAKEARDVGDSEERHEVDDDMAEVCQATAIIKSEQQDYCVENRVFYEDAAEKDDDDGDVIAYEKEDDIGYDKEGDIAYEVIYEQE